MAEQLIQPEDQSKAGNEELAKELESIAQQQGHLPEDDRIHDPEVARVVAEEIHPPNAEERPWSSVFESLEAEYALLEEAKSMSEGSNYTAPDGSEIPRDEYVAQINARINGMKEQLDAENLSRLERIHTDK